MYREIEFRQPIFIKGKFERFNYWGVSEKGFSGPLIGIPGREIYNNQFTGLIDNKGIKIFEGDIVKIGNEELFTVEYFGKRASFVMIGIQTGKLRLFEDIEQMKDTQFRIDINLIEVVGNIYKDNIEMKLS